MDVHLTLEGRTDLAAAIYAQLRAAVLSGRLGPGERLPPSRELAVRLAVSRTTVASAYERLVAEGFLVGRVGAGTYVSSAGVGSARALRAPAGAVQPRAIWQQVQTSPRVPAGTRYDFSAGVPDVRMFPLQSWRRLVTRELRRARLGADYADPAGHAGLRAAIARHVGMSRSVQVGPDDVLVTNGAQQALDLIARVLVDPGGCVAVEEPGYLPARRLFTSLGARVVGVPVDGEGLVVDAIPGETRLVYTTPSHQYPLGTVMSLARRSALLDWAGQRGAVVVEDDYDSEFRFSGRPLEPLQSIDRSGRVVYVGTFSKTLLPTLRVGFCVVPASLRAAMLAARQLSDWHGDQVTQGALAGFIDEGLLARHVRRTAREYAARHDLVVTVLERDFADSLVPVRSAAGMHLTARVGPDADVDTGEVVRRAAVSGVAVRDLADYCAGPAQAGLVIGYGAATLEQVTAGLALLRQCLD